MSQPSRPRAQGSARRRKRNLKIASVVPLEERCLLAPYLPLFPLEADFTATAGTTTNANLGTVVVSQDTTVTDINSAAPITSVSQMTPASTFGGDMVRVKAGPGGVFGNGLYAISRGSGGKVGAVNRPGVIYRVDPATGKASVFFDLNTVMSQLDPNALNTDGVNPAANSLGGVSGTAVDTTGFRNWYDIAFDSEGYIDGKPSMLVSTSDRDNPAKNAIYRIAPNGEFLGAFVTMTGGLASTRFNMNPTAMTVPGPEMQQFLRGVIAGSGASSTSESSMAALFFDANQYAPGQVISNGVLPPGVSQTGMLFGPIAGMTAANADYISPVYSAFTDFGTPAAGGIPARPGLSGVQGSKGDLLIGLGNTTPTLPVDQRAVVTTPFRRFQDIAFDQYGYFSIDVPLTASASGSTGSGGNVSATTLEIDGQPTYAGSLFVSDLATGLSVNLTSIAEGDIPAGVVVPVSVQGSGVLGLAKQDPSLPYDPVNNPLVPITQNGNTTGGGNPFGGRLLRITPTGVMTVFAQGFSTSGAQDSTSFMNSSLTLDFSADGTTLYVSDGDGVWQFKTTASLAGSTSGSIVGLNDLRSLGVPYDGRGSAVAIVDTGVDGTSTPFRGRVGKGKNLYTGGPGNQDVSSFSGGGGTTTGGTGGTTGGTGTSGGNTLANTFSGHGTPVAGVVAQFVPQATLEPIAIFSPWVGSLRLTSSTSGTGTGGGQTGGGQTGGQTGTSTLSATANALTSTNGVYNGMDYVAKHPFVNDPVRPGVVSRVVASTFAFGTTETFVSEGDAFRRYPQIVIALKNQLHKFRKMGIAPIAAAGQFGAPLGAGSGTTTGTGGAGGTGGTANANQSTLRMNNNAANRSLGDTDGMAMPAIFNEAISVTGTYPFPYFNDVSSTPINSAIGVIPNPLGPVLVFGDSLSIGGTASSSSTGGTGGTGGTTTTGVSANVNAFAASDFTIWSDRIPGAVNRGITTDFAAPSIDVPTFRRRFAVGQVPTSGGSTTGGSTTTAASAGDPANHLTFDQVGTSMSTGIVTGVFAMVSSALDYWTNINKDQGVTSDAYLTTPVGVRSLNFGSHAIGDLSAFNNPDGINGILAWTAVPVFDVDDGGSLSTPDLISTTDKQNGFEGGYEAPAYARISASNAIAAIEGTIALKYLIDNNVLPVIDTNNDGIITAQEVQNFTDTAAIKGMAEAGAMARLLGGTATTALPQAEINNRLFNENPDQPGALQRRFNFFDYVANGQLKGGVTIDGLKMLSNNLLPQPDSNVVIDRQRASANGFLVDPDAQRNITALQQKLPRFMWVPTATVAKFRNMSPARFKIGRNETPGTYFPVYTLFQNGPTVPDQVVVETKAQTVSQHGQTITRNLVRRVPVVAPETPAPTAPVDPTPAPPAAPPASTTTNPAGSAGMAGTAGTADTTAKTGNAATAEEQHAKQVLDALLNLANQAQQNQTGSNALPKATPMAVENTSAAATERTAEAETTAAPAESAPAQTPVAEKSAETELAEQQQAAASAEGARRQAILKANANKQKKNFFEDVWDGLKRPFA